MAPADAMAGREVFLPRRSLSIGAQGRGDAERRYRLVANLDKGGMGELFLAELHAPGEAARYVVVKRLLADLLDDDKYVAMFVSEAAVMSKLDHPNIVRVFDTPTIDGTRCLAMEYVRGRNVQQILARTDELGARMPPAVVLRVMSQVLRGLDYAHNYRLDDGTPLGLVHRDVTPGNVLVSFDGAAKLTDFGIAKSQMSAVSTTVGIVKGKARYLAPEQILGEQATPRSDVFSSANVVLEMLTGAPVFDRGSVPKTLYAIVNGERADVEQSLGFRAPLLVQLLNRALATDPKQRIPSAKELADGLDAAVRLLGKVQDKEVGPWLRELFRDVEDPLAAFDPSQLAGAERATVHALRAESAIVPSPRDTQPGAHEEPGEGDRGADDRAPDDGAALERLVTSPSGRLRNAASALARAIDEDETHAAPVRPRASSVAETGLAPTPSEPLHDPDTAPGELPRARRAAPPPPAPPAPPQLTPPPAPQPTPEELALAADSAHGVVDAPTHVIRGTPVAPGPVGSSVDEALAALAWIQSQRKVEPAPVAGTPAILRTTAPARTPETGRAPEPAGPSEGARAGAAARGEGDAPTTPPRRSEPPRARPELSSKIGVALGRPSRAQIAILYALGVLSGVIGTLAIEEVLARRARTAGAELAGVHGVEQSARGSAVGAASGTGTVGGSALAPGAADAGGAIAASAPDEERAEVTHTLPSPEDDAPAEGAAEDAPADDEPSAKTAEESAVDQAADRAAEARAASAAAAQSAFVDLMEPKGARVRLDGVLLERKVPFRGLVVRPGRHQLRIFKGTWKHDLTFSVEPGEKLDLTKRLKRRTAAR